jgi:hypothetical protein
LKIPKTKTKILFENTLTKTKKLFENTLDKNKKISIFPNRHNCSQFLQQLEILSSSANFIEDKKQSFGYCVVTKIK